MGKVLRCWLKLPSIPLRLFVVAVCGWAVYIVSTGFIFPSISPTATFLKQEGQQLHSWKTDPNHFFLDFASEFHKSFEKHLHSKHSTTNEKSKPASTETIGNKQNELQAGYSALDNKTSSLLRDDIETNNEANRSKTASPHQAKGLGSQIRSFFYGANEEKNKDIDNFYYSQENNMKSDFGWNSQLNQASKVLFHETDYQASFSSPVQKRHARDRNKPKAYLRITGNNPSSKGTFYYRASNYIDEYGLGTFPSIHKYLKPFRTTYRNQKKTSLYIGYHQRTNQEITQASHVSNRSTEVKIILLWTPLFKGWNFLPEGPTAFTRCREIRCEVTSDRSRLKDSHAVVFHIRTMSLLDLPPFRLTHQKWIFFSLEPPPQSYFPGFHFMYGMFNWTMTYRRDSDIVIPYGRVTSGSSSPQSSKPRKDWESLWKRKTKRVIWMVSHCNTYSKREDYVYQLQKFIDVDILGSCGAAVCLFNETRKCLEAFSKRYKFFLAFENSICDDYVTEKFFRALQYDIVPVVLGGVDYKVLAPPGSYINAADYPSPEALADYLHSVSENSKLYRTYLKWKDNDFVVEDKPSPCSLCQKVHSVDFEATSSYIDIAKWWVQNSHCTKWTLK